MPSQPKCTTVTPEELARAIVGIPDPESNNRLIDAREGVYGVLAQLHACLKRLKEIRDSLHGELPEPEWTDETSDFSLEIPRGADLFRPGHAVYIGTLFFHTLEEADLKDRISCCMEHSGSTGDLDCAIETLELMLSLSLPNHREKDVREYLAKLPDEQIQMIADAGIRNGWLEVDDEG